MTDESIGTKEIVKIKEYETVALGYRDRANAITEVNTDGELAVAGELYNEIRKEVRDVKKTTKDLTEPFRKGVARMNCESKLITDPLEALMAAIKLKADDYTRKKEIEKKRLQREEEERQLKIAQAAEDVGDTRTADAIVDVAASAKPAPSTVRSQNVTVSARKDWTHEVVDLNKVPRKYLVLSPAAVNADIRAGVRDIEGLRIFEKVSSSFRGR